MGLDISEIAGGAIGGITNAAGQFIANRSNQAINRRNNDFNAQQARLQRDWEERMSNTSYQRAIADMRRAGVNPMLLFSKGVGASTPTGTSATSQSPTPQGNVLSGFGHMATSAVQLAMLKTNLEKLQADRDLSLAMAKTQQTQSALNAANAANSAQDLENKAQINRQLKLQGDMSDTTYGRALAWVDRTKDTVAGLIGLVGDVTSAVTSGASARREHDYRERKLQLEAEKLYAPSRSEKDVVNPHTGVVKHRTITRSYRS